MNAATASCVPVPVWSHTRHGWTEIVAAASPLAATIDAYLGEVATTLAPASVQAAETTLRQFAGRVVAIDPGCRVVASITEQHVRDYLEWLAQRVDPTTGRTVSSNTVNYRLGQLRWFFERIDRWGYADVPVSLPVPPRPGRQQRSQTPTRQRSGRPVDAPVPKAVRSTASRRTPKVVDTATTRRSWHRGPDSTWDEIRERAPRIATTMTAYLEQLAVSSRPATVAATSLALRQFAAHLTRHDPACRAVAEIERRHIEAYKVALVARPGRRGNTTVSTTTVRLQLGMIRTFFERIIDYDYPDAPRRVPVFAGDLPKADEPLPRSLDDPTAAKFMAGLATDPNRRRRLMVELLARTGMRVGELAGLRDDAMHRHGDTWWLRVPIGKLHNDRTVPLHPMLVELINDYRTWRGPSTTGLLVERNDHQPFDRRTIHRYVAAVARRAGVGHVHPHQLRHTLATQSIVAWIILCVAVVVCIIAVSWVMGAKRRRASRDRLAQSPDQWRVARDAASAEALSRAKGHAS